MKKFGREPIQDDMVISSDMDLYFGLGDMVIENSLRRHLGEFGFHRLYLKKKIKNSINVINNLTRNLSKMNLRASKMVSLG